LFPLSFFFLRRSRKIPPSFFLAASPLFLFDVVGDRLADNGENQFLTAGDFGSGADNFGGQAVPTI
jgi:hypothetical protein